MCVMPRPAAAAMIGASAELNSIENFSPSRFGVYGGGKLHSGGAPEGDVSPTSLCCAQVVRRLRFAVVLQVRGCCARDDVHLRHAPRGQSGLPDGPDAQRHVDAFGDEVDDAIIEAQVQFDQRVAPGEFGQGRKQQVAPERDGHVHPQFALRLGARVAQGLFRVAQFFEDAARAAQEFGAFGGERDPARRPVQQACAEVLFERGDVRAGRGS